MVANKQILIISIDDVVDALLLQLFWISLPGGSPCQKEKFVEENSWISCMRGRIVSEISIKFTVRLIFGTCQSEHGGYRIIAVWKKCLE